MWLCSKLRSTSHFDRWAALQSCHFGSFWRGQIRSYMQFLGPRPVANFHDHPFCGQRAWSYHWLNGDCGVRAFLHPYCWTMHPKDSQNFKHCQHLVETAFPSPSCPIILFEFALLAHSWQPRTSKRPLKTLQLPSTLFILTSLAGSTK